MRCWPAAAAELSITEIGEITLRPDKVVGMHWFAGTRLVEIVEGDDTSGGDVQIASNFAQAIRKSRCGGRVPGFVAGRAGRRMRRRAGRRRGDGVAFVEACLVLEEGVAGVREIDLALVLGAGMKPGPFAAADREGLRRWSLDARGRMSRP